MARRRKPKAKAQRANAKAAPHRQPPGQPSTQGVVKRKENKKPKQTQRKAQPALRKKGGGQATVEAVDVVPEDGMIRHHEVVQAHSDAIMAITMAEDAIYTASRDKVLKRWKPVLNATGRFELQEELKVELGDIAWSLVHAWGDWLFCGLGSGKIRGFCKSAAIQSDLEGHTKRVTCLLPHQEVLMSGSLDGTVRFWTGDAARNAFTCTHSLFEGISSNVHCLAILNDILWVGGNSGVSLVELHPTLRVVVQVPPRKHAVSMLQFQGHMIVAYQDGSTSIFSATGESKHSQTALPAGPLTCIGGLDSGPRLLVGHTRGQMTTVTLPEFKPRKTWQALKSAKVQSICCTGQGGIFMVGAENGNLQLWQREEGMGEL